MSTMASIVDKAGERHKILTQLRAPIVEFWVLVEQTSVDDVCVPSLSGGRVVGVNLGTRGPT
jgi:hypothetical protein